MIIKKYKNTNIRKAKTHKTRHFNTNNKTIKWKIFVEKVILACYYHFALCLPPLKTLKEIINTLWIKVAWSMRRLRELAYLKSLICPQTDWIFGEWGFSVIPPHLTCPSNLALLALQFALAIRFAGFWRSVHVAMGCNYLSKSCIALYTLRSKDLLTFIIKFDYQYMLQCKVKTKEIARCGDNTEKWLFWSTGSKISSSETLPMLKFGEKVTS